MALTRTRLGSHPLGKSSRTRWVLGVFIAILVLDGCGTTTPNLRPDVLRGDLSEGLSEERLLGYIKCSLGRALSRVSEQYRADLAQYPETAPADPTPWLKEWGAQVSLKVTVDENSTIAPSLGYKQPRSTILNYFQSGDVMGARSSTLGVSASVTADATRIEGIQTYFYFPTLIPEYASDSEPCKPDGRYFIAGDLKIDDFMTNKVRLAQVNGLLEPKNGPNSAPLDAFTYEVTFVLTTSAGINPAWFLTRISIDPGSGNLFGGTRKKTNDLIITIGPTDQGKAATGMHVPTERAKDAHVAALIGQALK